MTTKTIQMYRTNLDGSETTLYPLTEAKYVTMDDGTTIEEALTNSDSSKYSPVIESLKAMFKVGEGDNVDLSESVIDGAYNSCVLKGKTMVNCIQEPSTQDVVLPYEFEDGQYVTINDTKESGALGVELKGQTLVNLCQNLGNETSTSTGVFISGEISVKTNTTYMVVAKVKSSNPLSSIPLSSFLRVDSIITGNILGGVTGDITTAYTTKSFTFNTGNTTTVKINLRNAYNDWGLTKNTAYTKEVMLIEYQEGMENWDIPYFEGMASCKMPILRTVGKNLFDGQIIRNACLSNDGNYYNLDGAVTFSHMVYVKGLKEIYLSISNSYASGMSMVYSLYDKNKKFITRAYGNYYPETGAKFSISDDVYYLKATFHTFSTTAISDDVDIKIQLEGKSVTSYEPYKTSILSLPEEVVLRSLPNGVCDTFNTTSGILTKKTQEVVLNGVNEKWTVDQGSVDTNTGNVWFKASIGEPVNYFPQGIVPSVADKFPTHNINIYVNRASMGICIENHIIEGELRLQMNIPQALIGGTSIENLKNYLKQNPVTIIIPSNAITTKINLLSTLKSWNTTTHIYSEIPENSLYPILSHSNPTYPVILKPSTKYSIVANSYSNDHTNSAINFNLGGATASTTVGSRVTTITTPSTLSNELLTMSGRGNKLNNVMVIEGDVAGDEPYFEGICDCKTPILSNVGKNLFTTANISSLSNADFEINDNNELIVSKNVVGWYNVRTFFKLTPNEKFSINYKYEILSGTPYVAVIAMDSNNTTITDNTVPNDGLVQLRFYCGNGSNVGFVRYYDIQLEESSTPTKYEPHKSNILSIPAYYDEESDSDKTIVLRSLPKGVCDTLNIETGEYVQRIDEVVLCGNNDEMWSVDTRKNNRIGFVSRATYGQKVGGGKEAVISDKLVTVTDGDMKYSMDYTITLGAIANYPIVITVPFNAIGESLNTEQSNTVSTNSLKTWLSQNPVTVQYELATPIVTTIDVQGFPYAYKDGHVQLSSGHSGQSLTPKVEYSLVANRNGQIEANTKSIRRHQDKLDDFEALMLTQMIQTHYEKTLLQFDFEMQMMALGGE